MRKLLLSIISFSLICSAVYLPAQEEPDLNPSQDQPDAPFLSTEQVLEAIPPDLRNLPYAVYPNDPTYNTERLNFNKRFVYFPKAIIFPETNEQIQFVIRALKKHDRSFAIRNGRHCFEPGSLSSDFIVDVSKFNVIIPNIEKETVYIGSGCQLDSVVTTLGKLDYAIPTGTCPTVGISGLTMGGGIGFLGRPFGLTCDAVQSITFLNAEAEIIEVNESSHPDLFWALRGGGNGSYGIVLGFTFKIFYVPIVTYYELIWEWDPKLVVPLMTAWQEWVATLPDNITTVLGLRHPRIIIANQENIPPVSIRIHGIKVGPEPFNEWIAAFEKFNPEVVRIVQDRYIKTAQFWKSEPRFPFNKNKSRILTKPVSKDVMKQVRRFFEEIDEEDPDFHVYFNFEAFGGVIPKFDTAFFPRNAFGWWQQSYYWKFQEENAKLLALSSRFYRNIPSEVSKFCYANFIDYELGKTYLEAYFGTNVDRLIEVKNIYDPTNLFHWKQSIPLKRKDN